MKLMAAILTIVMLAAPAAVAATRPASQPQNRVKFAEGRAELTLPPGYEHDLEGEQTIAVYPPGGDAISFRLTLLRTFDDGGDEAAEEFVRAQAREAGKRVETVGDGVWFVDRVSPNHPSETEPGVVFHLTHRQIGMGGRVYTMTVGLIKGKERNPEVKRLARDLPNIVASLRVLTPTGSDTR